jgi:hypothetical protein
MTIGDLKAPWLAGVGAQQHRYLLAVLPDQLLQTSVIPIGTFHAVGYERGINQTGVDLDDILTSRDTFSKHERRSALSGDHLQ